MATNNKLEIRFKGRPIAFLFPKNGERKNGSFQIVKFEEIEHISGPALPPGIPNIDDGRVTAVLKGEMPLMASRGEYIVSCCEATDRARSPWAGEKSFKVIDIRADCDFDNPVDIAKFCLFIMTAAQRDALLAVYPDPISILKSEDLEAMRKVKGFGPVVSRRIFDAYAAARGSEMAYIRLSQYGLTKKAITGLIEWYHSPDIALEAIEDNPYNLLKVPQYGWKRADAVALRQGMQRNDTRRILAYAMHLLEDLLSLEGDSWVDIQDLFNTIYTDCAPLDSSIMCDTIKAATITERDFESEYSRLMEEKRFCSIRDFTAAFCYDEKGRRIGLLEVRLTEREIKRHLDRLKGAFKDFAYDKEECLGVIHECERRQGFAYTKEQYDAIWKMLDSNVSVLTGRAGCGKSTVLSAIAKIAAHFNTPMEQCALSGRASSNLTDITGIEGKTIHRLLNFQQGKGFKFTEANPLPVKMIVLDETSMVGGPLFLSLVSAIPTGAKFIMVGDTAQLDPIGGNAIFKDCIQSRFVPIAELTEIHRQAAASGIIRESLRVSDGKALLKSDACGTTVRGDNKDFRIIALQDESFLQEAVVGEYKRLVEEVHVDPHDIQVITPLKSRGDLNCLVLNDRIQSYLHERNGIVEDDKHVQISFQSSGETRVTQRLYVGDRVMVMVNNYSAKTLTDEDTQIFNGNIGYVTTISKERGDSVVVRFAEQGLVCLAPDELASIQLAYAATVHKFQGTGIDYVIFSFDGAASMLGSRELVYTALTRAKKMCTLICVPKRLNSFTHISKIKEKHTWLSSDLTQASSDAAMSALFGKKGQ